MNPDETSGIDHMPPDGTDPPPGWRGLYDQAVRQGNDWQALHHNGGALDHGAALKQYRQLQDRLTQTIDRSDTPEEARAPLASAGYQLYTGANAVGLAGPEQVPYSAFLLGAGIAPFGHEGAVGLRIKPVPRAGGLLPPASGNRTALAVDGGGLGSMAARSPAFRTPGPRPSNRADLHQDLIGRGFSIKETGDKGYIMYQHGDGRRVTVKPTGEVIPVRPTVSSGGKRYRERTDYDFVRLPDQSHSTGHFVEPLLEGRDEHQ
jgi:hypothetical protein